MKMRIEFDMDGAAFFPEYDTELRRILSDILKRACDNAETGRGIQDSNGNRIGQWVITEN